MEYFTRKKEKKHHEEKTRSEVPVLTPNDELFLERMVSEEGSPPPLPDRSNSFTTGVPPENDGQLVLHESSQNEQSDDELSRAGDDAMDSKTSEEEVKGGSQSRVTDRKGDETTVEERSKSPKGRRMKTPWSLFQRVGTKKEKKSKSEDKNVAIDVPLTSDEGKAKVAGNGRKTVNRDPARKEENDISEVLEKLNLSAENNKAFSLSKESQVLVQKFTLVLKDLVNGVPTAYDDLVGLLDESQGQLQKSYGHLPPFLQKLIKTSPTKLTGNLAPEFLATAAAAEGMGGAAGEPGKKTGIRIPNLKDLVTKPGAVVGILKAIMNTLKLRWPAFIGTNVLWSLGLFVLLFVFWYCHKRGREVRLAKEKLATDECTDAEGSGRVEELEDDQMLEGEIDLTQPLVGRRSSDNNSNSKDNGGVKKVQRKAHRKSTTVSDAERDAERRRKWASAPSNAPLDSQQSCIVS
ncbi:MAG: hypothetical protein M1837_005957 [Sclerophora amabilis]|nr:MAG: hypothetical protein M1837_005957 [Sclerophora amabilis]